MSEERYIGAIDQGTTGTRFMVFDHDGQVVANAYQKHEQVYPEPGWVEHKPQEIWENTKEVIDAALAEAGIGSDQLDAIGITNQRETTLIWDRESGKPIHNAIVWQDRRTTDRVEKLQEEGKEGWIREKTGLEPDAYFSATKAEWLLDNTDQIKLQRMRPDDVRERAEQGELMFG
ncbi:FGGY family carbohydrate kinase, partial [Halopelagius fulvigenes]